MKAEHIVARIREHIPGAGIRTEGRDCHFEVHIVSPTFEGIKLLKRQQPLLSLFRDEIDSGDLHALTIKAMTPEEAEALL